MRFAALLAVAMAAAGCGATGGPGGPAAVRARFVAYARCMRSHRVPDFPDPTTSPGGGISFQINAGPGSDLNHHSPAFIAADRACRSLLPAQPPAARSAAQLAALVRWAGCIRSHGVPRFPDPYRNGAFDSSRFDPGSPAFDRATTACRSLQPPGPVAVQPGHG